MDDKKINFVKQEAEKFYKTIGEIFCPYLKEKIYFNAKGLEHLKFNRKNHARPLEDQYMRLRLIKLAPEVLKLSHTIQGISHIKGFELMRSNSRNEMVLKSLSYYEFIAIVRDVRIRIVIKQIENGPKYFWSIIPFWKLDRETKIRKMSYGDPEVD